MASVKCGMQACRPHIQGQIAVLVLNSTGQQAGTQMGFLPVPQSGKELLLLWGTPVFALSASSLLGEAHSRARSALHDFTVDINEF